MLNTNKNFIQLQQINNSSSKSLPALEFVREVLSLVNQQCQNICELKQNKNISIELPCQKLKPKIITHVRSLSSQGKASRDGVKNKQKLGIIKYKTQQYLRRNSMKGVQMKKSSSSSLPKLSRVYQQIQQNIQPILTNTGRQIQRMRMEKLSKTTSLLQPLKQRFGKYKKNGEKAQNHLQKRGVLYYTYLGQKIQAKYKSPRNNQKILLDIRKSIGRISDLKLASPQYQKQPLNDEKDELKSLFANQFSKNQEDKQKQLLTLIKTNFKDKNKEYLKQKINQAKQK